MTTSRTKPDAATPDRNKKVRAKPDGMKPASEKPARPKPARSKPDRTNAGRIDIELAAPACVQGQPVRHQSLWILLRLWLAAQSGDGSGWVRETQLRDQFANARNLRMVISRAYADFARWGLRVGWGTDRSRDPDLLPLAGRNRGPYWLGEGEAARLQISLHGAVAGLDAVIAWLGTPDATRGAAVLGDASSASPAYWHAWAGARRDMLDGRLILDRDHGALAGYRRAQTLAPDPWLQALALLQ
ncbi:MAG: hypothetical protein WAZ48_04030, partial [Lysobacteraceae bacterium]